MSSTVAVLPLKGEELSGRGASPKNTKARPVAPVTSNPKTSWVGTAPMGIPAGSWGGGNNSPVGTSPKRSSWLLSQTPTSHLPGVTSETSHWEATHWEGLSWDHHAATMPANETDALWNDDLRSSSHWEESKSRDTSPRSSLTMSSSESDGEQLPTFSYEDFSEFQPSLSQQQVLTKLMLTRDDLVRWFHEPNFSRFTRGCYVRVNMGELSGETLFTIACIADVQEQAFFAYRVGHLHTTRGLSLILNCSSRRTLSLLAVSNQPVTEIEIQQWEAVNQSVVSSEEALEKESIITALRNKHRHEEPELDITSLLA